MTHRPPPSSISPRRTQGPPNRVRPGIYETCPSLQKPTGGRPTLDRLVEMSMDGDQAARRGVHQTTDGGDRVGGPDQGNLRRRS